MVSAERVLKRVLTGARSLLSDTLVLEVLADRLLLPALARLGVFGFSGSSSQSDCCVHG